MNAITTPVNRHPVDQLADIRETIKHLKEREDELRLEISVMMGECDTLGGDEYIAKQTLSTRKGGIDDAAMKRYGINPDKYRKKDTTVFSIKCERRLQEAA